MEYPDDHRVRQPLQDTTSRYIHGNPANFHTPAVRAEDIDLLKTPDRISTVGSPNPQHNKENRVSVATDINYDTPRSSVISASSILCGTGKRKTYVGPWQLGRTLGKGATGRVRLAKHAGTGQLAAIKIVSKKSATLVQSASIAAMDRNAVQLKGFSQTRLMPCGIEREVCIMKLIDHPNVMHLFDVWENRGEMYLVLEYVEGGELFEYVSKNGPLPEEEAVRLFRQIIAALCHLHRFNICHRDLKPENILLDANHNIKLADFGMAALQPAGHWLNTSCGSPHYAAPEIISGDKYRGDRADMWSCGVILFALLAGYLPFDGGDLARTLRLVRRGDYMLPPNVSHEAAHLLTCILQKKPENRINMKEIWSHPLLTKYEKLHNAMSPHYLGPPPPLTINDCGPPVSSRLDLDWDVMRNLQILWHDVKAEAVIERLMSLEPTHERMFYNQLVKFRDEQLENYEGAPMQYSASDYHHISRPTGRANRSRSNSRSRSNLTPAKRRVMNSRKTAVQEPKSCASVESYDPFRSPDTRPADAAYAQITVHRVPQDIPVIHEASPDLKPPPSIAEEDEEPEEPSPFTVLTKRKHKPASMRSFQSRIPHSSSRAPGMSTHSMRSRRNVSFHHARNRSQSSAKPKRQKIALSTPPHSPSCASLQTLACELDVPELSSSPPLPTQPTMVRPGTNAKNPIQARKIRDSDVRWKEDARQCSNELGKICEEAFNGASSVTTMRTVSTGTANTGYETPGTPVSMSSPKQRSDNTPNGLSTGSKQAGVAYSIHELSETRRKLFEHSKDLNDDIPSYLSNVIGHLDRLIDNQGQRQTPQYTPETSGLFACNFPAQTRDSSLPVINEELPSLTRTTGDVSSTDLINRNPENKATIRVVPCSSIPGMEEVKPLIIRKKTSFAVPEGVNTRDFSSSPRAIEAPISLPSIDESQSPKTGVDKKWSWFKHRAHPDSNHCPAPPPKDIIGPETSRDGIIVVKYTADSADLTSPEPVQAPEQVPSPVPEQARKSSVGGFFKKLIPKKSNKAPAESGAGNINANDLTIFCKGQADTDSSEDDKTTPPVSTRRSTAHTNHNWFARVFQIKPASRIIALNVSKFKGRKEIYKLLREWKKYGMEKVAMDKNNNTVQGRVGHVNMLRIREVEFTAEFFTVLEHSRPANLSLVRFKQDRGAASSFNKVVETVHLSLQDRGLIVEDVIRAKQMTRVLANTNPV